MLTWNVSSLLFMQTQLDSHTDDHALFFDDLGTLLKLNGDKLVKYTEAFLYKWVLHLHHLWESV